MDPIEQVLDFITSADDKVHNTPEVTLSYAQSLDGSLAHHRGIPLALSGPESLRLTHRLRAAHQAILVGVGTVIADDPQLSVRLAPGPDPQPVILDSLLRIPPGSRLLQANAGPEKPSLWIGTTTRADPARSATLKAAGVRLIELPPDAQGRVPLPDLLAILAESGIKTLMVEGGARVIRAFLAGCLADRVVITISPRFVGGLKAVESPLTGASSLQGHLPDQAASHFPQIQPMRSAMLGDDLIVWGGLRYPAH